MTVSHDANLPNEETALLAETKAAKKPTPLPKTQLAMLMLAQLAEPISAHCITPFVRQMISDLGVAGDDEAKVGYYVGVMLSLFFATEALTVMHWSRLSDHIGRKPVLLSGLAGITISMLLLGLSRSFFTLVLARSLCGLLNGNTGVAKSAIGELTDKSNRAQAFALIPVIWATGVTIAPMMGGSLQHPAERFPQYFSHPFWQEYPYFLPCAIASIYSAFAFVMTFIFFEEPNKHSCPERPTPSRSSSTDTLPVTPISTLPKSILNEQLSNLTLQNVAAGTPLAAPFMQSEPPALYPSPPAAPTKPAPLCELLRSERVRISVINYGVVAILDIAHAALQPLVLATPIAFGGLGMDPPTIGALLGAVGLLNGAFQGAMFARIVNRFGLRRLFIAGIAAFIPMFMCFPSENYAAWKLGKEGEPLPMLVWIIIAIQALFLLQMEMAFGTIFVYITSAAPNKRSLGATNGIAQLLASIVRAIGPATAAALFSVSTGQNILGGYFVYVILIGATFVGLRIASVLPNEAWSSDDD